jgi:hypothetical protein
MRTVVLIAAIIIADALSKGKDETPKSVLDFLRLIFFCTVLMDLFEFLHTITH